MEVTSRWMKRRARKGGMLGWLKRLSMAASGAGAPSVAFSVVDDRARVLAEGGVSCGGTVLMNRVAA